MPSFFTLQFDPTRQSWFRTFTTTFHQSNGIGDTDFSAVEKSSPFMADAMTFLFAFLMVIVLFNLLIAVMSEAYDDVKTNAEAIWCYQQFTQLEDDVLTINRQACRLCPATSTRDRGDGDGKGEVSEEWEEKSSRPELLPKGDDSVV